LSHSPLIIKILLHISDSLELLLLPLRPGDELIDRPHLFELLQPLTKHILESFIFLFDAPDQLLHGLESVCLSLDLGVSLFLLEFPLLELLVDQVSVLLKLSLLGPLIGVDIGATAALVGKAGFLVSVLGIEF